MKIAPRLLLSALGVLALTGCGGGGGSDSPATGGGEMAAPSESSGEAAAQLGSGESADIEAFFRDYEELVDKYCDFADHFSTASLEEMAQLGQEMANQSLRMTEYSSRAIALRASFSPAAEEKFEALEKKAEACAEKIGR